MHFFNFCIFFICLFLENLDLLVTILWQWTLHDRAANRPSNSENSSIVVTTNSMVGSFNVTDKLCVNWRHALVWRLPYATLPESCWMPAVARVVCDVHKVGQCSFEAPCKRRINGRKLTMGSSQLRPGTLCISCVVLVLADCTCCFISNPLCVARLPIPK